MTLYSIVFLNCASKIKCIAMVFWCTINDEHNVHCATCIRMNLASKYFMRVCEWTQPSPGDQIYGCQPGKSLHRFCGSLASWISLLTWPLTLNCTPSSSPCSFCCSRKRARPATLLTFSRFSSVVNMTLTTLSIRFELSMHKIATLLQSIFLAQNDKNCCIITSISCH